MSDWSRVLICWSGIDDAVRTAPKEEERLKDILESLDSKRCRVAMAHSCPGCGNACEAVAIIDVNYFIPDDLQSVLASMEWEYPEQVEFFYKSEEMERYRRCAVFPHLPLEPLENHEE